MFLASNIALLQALENVSEATVLMIVKSNLLISSEKWEFLSEVEIAKIVSPSIGVWDGCIDLEMEPWHIIDNLLSWILFKGAFVAIIRIIVLSWLDSFEILFAVIFPWYYSFVWGEPPNSLFISRWPDKKFGPSFKRGFPTALFITREPTLILFPSLNVTSLEAEPCPPFTVAEYAP